MVTIYEVKTGKPIGMQYMIDAKESVATGGYTFQPPAPKVEKVVEKVVEKPVVKKEAPEEVEPEKTVTPTTKRTSRILKSNK